MSINFKLSFSQRSIVAICFIPLLFLTYSSCAYLFGYRTIHSIDLGKHEKICSKHKFQEMNCVLIDTGYFKRLKSMFDDSLVIKDLSQPLQAHYFVEDQLVSSLINCYAGVKGFQLDWEENTRFSRFPPIGHPTKLKTMQLQDFYNLVGSNLPAINTNTVFVVWSNILPKHSQRFLK